MNELTALVRELGGAAAVSSLQKLGMTRWSIRAAVARGDLLAVRSGWVAIPDASADVIRCVAIGGRLGCISAAQHLGLWVPREFDSRIHVAVPRHAGRIALPLAPDLIPHWASASWHSNASVIENIYDTLRQVVLCCARETAVAILDSAINRGLISRDDLARILRGMEPRYASILEDLNGASESGLESIARYRFTLLGLMVRAQAVVGSAGRVDLLIGDRLAFETDGKEWHAGADAFERDRSKDLMLAALGYVVIRVSYEMVIRDWALIELAVMGIVERGEHLWSAAHRLAGLAR